MLGVIESVARPVADAHFAHTFTNRLYIPRIAFPKSSNPFKDSRPCLQISKSFEPLINGVRSPGLSRPGPHERPAYARLGERIDDLFAIDDVFAVILRDTRRCAPLIGGLISVIWDAKLRLVLCKP